jgi:ABC transport system ATP-binding/permease protein
VVLFSQHRTEIDPAITLREALSAHSDSVIYQGRPVHVHSWAKRFLFTTEQLKNPVRALSGGEQARIHIARLMLEPADILILDEPTNDLDLASLEVLEESLEEFPGAIILITHDRAMIARLATKVLALDGGGRARYFATFDQWDASGFGIGPPQQPPTDPAPTPAAQAAPADPPAAATPVPESPKKKLSYKEQRELDEIESVIQNAEARAAAIESQLADPAATADRNKSAALYTALGQAQQEVARLYQRWTDLESRA